MFSITEEINIRLDLLQNNYSFMINCSFRIDAESFRKSNIQMPYIIVWLHNDESRGKMSNTSIIHQKTHTSKLLR